MILRFLLALLLTAASVSAANFPYITLSTTNRYRDNGTTLTRNGVPIGGNVVASGPSAAGQLFQASGVDGVSGTWINPILTNAAGVIKPIGLGQTTNTFQFTSALPGFTAQNPVLLLGSSDQPYGPSIQMFTDGSLFMGVTAFDEYYGINQFVIEHDLSQGEYPNVGFVIETVDKPAYTARATVAGDAQVPTDTNNPPIAGWSGYAKNYGGTNSSTGWTLTANEQDNPLFYIWTNRTVMNFLPGIASGTVYLFDTVNPLAASDVIAAFRNATTNVVAFMGDGTLIVPTANIATANVGTLNVTNAITVPLIDAGAVTVTNWAASLPIVTDANTNATTTNAIVLGGTNLIGSIAGKVPTAGGTMTGPLVPMTYTVGTLPSAASYTGAQVYCSDALTPWGAGDIVISDGASWRTLRVKALATTDVPTFILSCATNGVICNTPKSSIDAFTFTLGTGYGGSLWRVSSGTVGPTTFTTNGTVVYYSTTTSATGAAHGYGISIPTMIAGDYYAMGGTYSVSAAPDGTDNHLELIGFSTATITNVPWATGAFFVYDRYNALGRSSPGSETNNWLCYTTRVGATNYFDSGLLATIGTIPSDRLEIVLTTTSAEFRTNGVVCATSSASLPNLASLYLNRVEILKMLGGTAASLYEANPWYHVRRLQDRRY